MQHGRCEKGRRGTGESSSVENIGAVARILCHSADICHGVAMWRATALISVTCASGVHSLHKLMWQVARNQRRTLGRCACSLPTAGRASSVQRIGRWLDLYIYAVRQIYATRQGNSASYPHSASYPQEFRKTFSPNLRMAPAKRGVTYSLDTWNCYSHIRLRSRRTDPPDCVHSWRRGKSVPMPFLPACRHRNVCRNFAVTSSSTASAQR